MRRELIELLKQSTLLQAILTIVLLGVISYLIVIEHPVPDVLTNAFLLILGYYFGTKSQQAIERTVDKISHREL